MITVCIPTYNQACYLPKTLDSVLSQQGCEFNIVIANDCSPDNTTEVIESYAERYPDKITVINQPVNKGLVGNTQDCILAATGDYIAICEGDDYWCDDYKLAKQLKILEQNHDAAMVHTNWLDLYDESGEIVGHDEHKGEFVCESKCGIESVGEIMREEYRPIRFSSVMFRRSVLDQAIKDNVMVFLPEFTTLDIAFFYSLVLYGRFVYLQDATTIYRIQQESVSFTRSEEKAAKYSIGCFKTYEYYINKLSLDQLTIDTTLRRSFKLLYPYALKTRNRKLADELCAASMKFGYRRRIGQKLCHWGTRNRFLNSVITCFFNIVMGS